MRQLNTFDLNPLRQTQSLLRALTLAVAMAFGTSHAADVNILLVIADDMGSDATVGYPEGTAKAPMPVLQGLQANGVTFTNAWANPICSPTRATILTGRYGFRTGVQFICQPNNTLGVAVSEPSIPRALKNQANIASAAFGKWHTGRLDAAAPQTAQDHPILMGFSRYVGGITGAVANYNNWSRYVNNLTLKERLTTSTTYATTDAVNEAVSWINRNGNFNWLCWVAFNAPHSPYHKPPNHLHRFDALPTTGATNREYFAAMVESMDTELGRLLSSIPTTVREKTIVIFIGDNGTPNAVKSGGFRGSKDTIYEGGIRVPLVVSGALVANPNRTVSQLVNSTDIFATVMDVHGINLSSVNEGLPQDTVSFLPYIKNQSHPAPRTTAFVGRRSSGAANADFQRAVRNDRYKLLRFTVTSTGVTTEEFYDLQVDPLEATNILLRALTPTEQTNLDSLRTRLAELSN
jgi:arylsulfatase A-like enzyme